MPNITIAVPEELKKRMDSRDDINWSGVARNSFEKRLSDLEFFERIAKKVDITEEDAVQMGRELKRGTYEKHYAPRLERERALRSDHEERDNAKTPHKPSA